MFRNMEHDSIGWNNCKARKAGRQSAQTNLLATWVALRIDARVSQQRRDAGVRPGSLCGHGDMQRDGTQAQIVVDDTCPGLPAELLSRHESVPSRTL